MFNSLYLSRPWSACYEGDDDAEEAAAEKAAAEAAAAAAAAAGKTFTQDQVNHLIATDRRKLEDALKKTEKQYQELLSSQSLTEQERKALQANLEMVQGQLRSKEEQLQVEKKQIEETYAAKLQDIEKKATYFETLFRDSTIERALEDAAVKHEAWSPSQVVTLPARADEDVGGNGPQDRQVDRQYKPMVEMQASMPRRRGGDQAYTPEDAVKKMKDDNETWGNLFKSGVVSGIGAGTATGGLMPGQERQDGCGGD